MGDCNLRRHQGHELAAVRVQVGRFQVRSFFLDDISQPFTLRIRLRLLGLLVNIVLRHDDAFVDLVHAELKIVVTLVTLAHHVHTMIDNIFFVFERDDVEGLQILHWHGLLRLELSQQRLNTLFDG